MKRIIVLLSLLIASITFAQPADVTGAVDVQVQVSGVWEITLSTAAVDFGTMDPGANAPSLVGIVVRTNQKIPWYLKLNKDQDLTNTVDVTEVIPSVNFTYTAAGGAGTWAVGQFQSAPTTAYAADATEYKNLGAGTSLTTTYDLTIPVDAVVGLYTNTITYTLTATP